MTKEFFSVGFNTIDRINASNSSTSLKEFNGKTIKAIGVMGGEDTSAEGEPVIVGFIKTPEEIISTISGTANRAISDIADILANGAKSVTVKVEMRKSNSGRDFATLIALEVEE